MQPLRLTGSIEAPELRGKFSRADRLPGSPGLTAQEWAHKRLEDRVWDPSTGEWVIKGLGVDASPEEVLEELGVEVEWPEDGPLADLEDLDELWRPLLREDHGEWLVFPRLAGRSAMEKILGSGAAWDEKDLDKTGTKLGFFRALASDLLDEHGDPKPGLSGMDVEVVRAQRDAELADWRHSDEVVEAAEFLHDHDGTRVGLDEAIDVIASAYRYIPEWFGLDLKPSQEAGVYSMVGGNTFLTDDPGTGKTRMSLGAAAVHAARRLLIVAPPTALSNWALETREGMEPGWSILDPDAQVPLNGHKKPHADAFGPHVVVVRTAARHPAFPEAGAVIVPDSQIGSSTALFDEIQQWGPEMVIIDEAHRSRTWTTWPGVVARRVSRLVAPGRTLVLTGTPLSASPQQMVNLLQISGHLGPVFGGPSRFLDKYTITRRFGKRVSRMPRMRSLPDLNRALSEVWVRRTKAQMTDLPQKLRGVKVIDVDLKEHRLAHAELYLRVTEWLDEHPSARKKDLLDWAGSQVGLISPLRLAAGVSKLNYAVEYAKDWMDQALAEDGSCDRPLVMWVHHDEEVGRPLVEQLSKITPTGYITGSTDGRARQSAVEDFQAGRTNIIVCSIKAAGFAITLNRSADAVFVESDWDPDNISQAEDRIHRIGQERVCFITYLVAAGTLDMHMRGVLARKSQVLGELMSGSDLAVTEVTGERTEVVGESLATGRQEDLEQEATMGLRQIIEEMVLDCLENEPTKAEINKALQRREARGGSRR